MDDILKRFENAVEPQVRFLELLRQLTDAGRADWFQSKHELGFVYCLLDKEDLVEFEFTGGKEGDEPVAPSEPIAGVVSHYCNTTYLWLPNQARWDLLLSLLRAERIDDERFVDCRRIANLAPVRVLEERLKR